MHTLRIYERMVVFTKVLFSITASISARLELALNHTKKPCIASCYRRFSMNNKIKQKHKIKPFWSARAFGPSGSTKLV